MRFIGLDVHRDFAEVAVLEPGHPVHSWGGVIARLAELRGFATTLRADDAVALEATLGRPDPQVAHLLTIPGVDAAVALGVLATIGDIGRFRTPEQLVS
jgi:transposase